MSVTVKTAAGTLLVASAATVLGGLFAAAPANAAPGDNYVALSYSLSSNVGGAAINANESSANASSLQNCVANGGSQCVTYVNVKNACAAIAVGGQGQDEYSTATNADLQTARSQALVANGPGSHIGISGCSFRPDDTVPPGPSAPAPPAPEPAPTPAPPVSEDPVSKDYDHDGLSKHDELFVHHTNPFLADTDFDGVDDGIEITNGTNPRNPSSH